MASSNQKDNCYSFAKAAGKSCPRGNEVGVEIFTSREKQHRESTKGRTFAIAKVVFHLNPQRRLCRREEKISEGSFTIWEEIFIPCRFSARARMRTRKSAKIAESGSLARFQRRVSKTCFSTPCHYFAPVRSWS